MGDKNYQIDIREVLSRKYAGGYAKQEFLRLPDRYRMIGDGAFQDNIRIERLDLSDRLQVIGRNAFRHSIVLKEVRLPRSGWNGWGWLLLGLSQNTGGLYVPVFTGGSKGCFPGKTGS